MHPPVFVCGSPRSGTTLVSQILNAHPDLTIFDEVNLLDVARLWERLRDPRQLSALKGTAVTDSDLYKSIMRADSATELLSNLLFDDALPSRRWGEKYPDYVNTLVELNRLFPNNVVVFVLRDPRAILASMFRYKDSAARTAGDFWIVDDVAKGLAVLQRSAEEYVRNRDRVVSVKYEEIVLEPERAIRNLCDAVGLTFAGEMLTPKSGQLPGSAISSQFVRNGVELPWKNSNRSNISTEIVDRWRRDFDDAFWDEIAADLEPLMSSFGYVR